MKPIAGKKSISVFYKQETVVKSSGYYRPSISYNQAGPGTFWTMITCLTNIIGEITKKNKK